jgi:release factor glutamine methyltransferase
MSRQTDKVWTVLSMLEWATGYFEKKGVDSPRMSIEWLLADVLKANRLDLYLKFDRPLSSEELAALRPMVRRRAAHEPLQHITGSTDFMGCTIRVSPDVLIPRPETEQLVERVLNDFPNGDRSGLKLLDVGTGSGCIPIAIKKHRPGWSCTGLDISPEALNYARENAGLNEVDVDWLEGDLLELEHVVGSSGKSFDLVVSNPPYITPEEKKDMDPQVVNFEPSRALFHSDPEMLYEAIAKFAAGSGAALYFECNALFADRVAGLTGRYYSDVALLRDYSGKERFVSAKKPI